MTEQSKFKYIIFPEQTYVLDYGDFVGEVKGFEILAHLRRESYLSSLLNRDDREDSDYE